MSDNPNRLDHPHDGPCPHCGGDELHAVSAKQERVEFNDAGGVQQIRPWDTEEELWAGCTTCDRLVYLNDDPSIDLEPPYADEIQGDRDVALQIDDDGNYYPVVGDDELGPLSDTEAKELYQCLHAHFG